MRFSGAGAGVEFYGPTPKSFLYKDILKKILVWSQSQPLEFSGVGVGLLRFLGVGAGVDILKIEGVGVGLFVSDSATLLDTSMKYTQNSWSFHILNYDY